jgi:hypothetical protein
MAVAGWWADQRQETVAYLVEENRILRGHLRGRIRLTDEERRRLAMHGHRPSPTPSDRHDRHARHDSPVASAIDRAEMDVRDTNCASRCARGDPAVGRPDGGGESYLGLYADPRGAEERRPSRRSLDDCAHREGARSATRTAAADVVADFSSLALGRDRRGPISSQPKCGRGAAWRRTTRCSSSISRHAASRLSGPRRILGICSCAKSVAR